MVKKKFNFNKVLGYALVFITMLYFYMLVNDLKAIAGELNY